MVDVSVIIPARGEQFLTPTIEDLVRNARADTEVIVVLEGYWPERMVDEPNVHYIHHGKPKGMRGALNAGVALAKGKYVMKLDGHCMVGEGFDKILTETCHDDWVCVPTRHRLDPEKWEINNGSRPPINYLYMDASNEDINFKEWKAKNQDKSLDAVLIDDILSCQGSCYFMPRDYWYKLELLDEANYGTFRKDPQEVCFKAWLSGGRVVRVKKTWYAHLHKGRKYGRGYGTSRGDWRKGDEYIKKWVTDSAWDKQTKSFKWLMRKFRDMPGWEDHEWIKGEVVDYSHLPNLYQYLEVNGQPFSRPKRGRAKSKFWNEGKWETFIGPMLPEYARNQTFVEMGCDAGLFLKLAKDRGYDRAVGIEKNKTPVREGLRFRDTIGYDYELLKRTLGGGFGENGSFDIDKMPVADVTLMSTFHYYVDINAWFKYLDKLRTKSCHVLIVSRPDLRQLHWLAKADYKSVAEYFWDWEEVERIENLPTEGDSKPRELYSVLFKSPAINRVRIADIDIREHPGNMIALAMADLAEKVAGREDFDPLDTDYYHKWKARKEGKWSERTLGRFVQMKVGVMESVRDDGLRDPIIVQRDGLQLSDGGHRLAMLVALGHTSAIVREV